MNVNTGTVRTVVSGGGHPVVHHMSPHEHRDLAPAVQLWLEVCWRHAFNNHMWNTTSATAHPVVHHVAPREHRDLALLVKGVGAALGRALDPPPGGRVLGPPKLERAGVRAGGAGGEPDRRAAQRGGKGVNACCSWRLGGSQEPGTATGSLHGIWPRGCRFTMSGWPPPERLQACISS